MLIGFLLLIKGADLLVQGAAAAARRIGVSDLTIGLTVVGFGTSTPELVVNIMAGVQGTTALAIGNVLGSNIANVFLILGVTALIRPDHRFDGGRFRHSSPGSHIPDGVARNSNELAGGYCAGHSCQRPVSGW
jgi:Ca2+/Na+ antiporter